MQAVGSWPELWDIWGGCFFRLSAGEELGRKLVPGSTSSLKDPSFSRHAVLVLNVHVTDAATAKVQSSHPPVQSREQLHVCMIGLSQRQG